MAEKASSTVDSKDLKLRNMLLGPACAYLGEELKGVVQGTVESLKRERREKNITKHIEAVENKLASNASFDLSYKQLDMFEEWVEEASKIDPEEEELSLLWQNLLISKKSSVLDIIMGKLKLLSSGDAIALIRLASNEKLNGEDVYRLKKLKELELIEKNDVFIEFFQLPVLLGFIGIIILSLFNAPLLNNTSTTMLPLFDVTSIFIYLLAPLLSYVGIIALIVTKLKRNGFFHRKKWKLTWIALELLKYSKVPN